MAAVDDRIARRLSTS